jgi:hypothetical protein
MSREPWIGTTSQLEIRVVHLHCMTDGLGLDDYWALACRQNSTAKG